MIGEAPKPPVLATEIDQRRPETPIIDVRDLLAGGREAIIIHAGERYRLRVTAKDRLILTK